MINQLVKFFMIIGICGMFIYPLRVAVVGVINQAESNYPTVVTGSGVTFLKSFHYWLPLIGIVLPALLWFYTQVQRPRA